MASFVEPSDLAAAVRLARGDLVAIVGGGGKTTSLFLLGSQFAGRTILTTTTRMDPDRTWGFPVLWDPSDRAVEQALADHRTIVVWTHRRDGKAIGVAPERCDRWRDLADLVVVEADGSAGRPFKAPADHEPVVPAGVTLVLGCVGAAGFNHPIADVCHRPERVAAIVGCSVADELTPERVATVLLESSRPWRGRRSGTRYSVVVHAVDRRNGSDVERLQRFLGGDVPVIAVRRDADLAAMPADGHPGSGSAGP